jgi:hypothetical protein
MALLAILFGLICVLFVGHLLRRDRFYVLAAAVYLAGFVYTMYMIYLYVE